jgi:hypothetical protein
MSKTITTPSTPSTLADLRADLRNAVANGTDAEHLAASVALIEAFTGRTLSEEEKAYL